MMSDVCALCVVTCFATTWCNSIKLGEVRMWKIIYRNEFCSFVPCDTCLPLNDLFSDCSMKSVNLKSGTSSYLQATCFVHMTWNLILVLCSFNMRDAGGNWRCIVARKKRSHKYFQETVPWISEIMTTSWPLVLISVASFKSRTHC